MANTFTVSASDMQSVIAQLETLNDQFKAEVNNLSNTQQALKSQWEGDANTAFNSAFESDKGQWDEFASLIDNYITSLNGIKSAYVVAEANNTTTATQRTY